MPNSSPKIVSTWRVLHSKINLCVMNGYMSIWYANETSIIYCLTRVWVRRGIVNPNGICAHLTSWLARSCPKTVAEEFWVGRRTCVSYVDLWLINQYLDLWWAHATIRFALQFVVIWEPPSASRICELTLVSIMSSCRNQICFIVYICARAAAWKKKLQINSWIYDAIMSQSMISQWVAYSTSEIF